MRKAEALYEALTLKAAEFFRRHDFGADPAFEIRPGVFRHENGQAYQCQDCKMDNPPTFHAPDDLWKQAGATGMLCPDCYAKRLGRPFSFDMLDDHGMNREILFGFLLAQRHPPVE